MQGLEPPNLDLNFLYCVQAVCNAAAGASMLKEAQHWGIV